MDAYLRQASGLLTDRASSIKDVSLYNGKAGIALFLFHYARYTGDECYSARAMDLLNEVADNISTAGYLGFFNGVTGIGWCIEYIVQNGFADFETDEILQELDDFIYAARQQRFITGKINEDVFGYGIYLLSRSKGNSTASNTASFLNKEHFIVFLVEECERMLYSNSVTSSLPAHTLGSVLFFLLEVRKKGLCKEIVEKIFARFREEVRVAHFTDRADRSLLLQMRSAIGLQHDEVMPRIYDNAVTECCKESLYRLVFAPWYVNTLPMPEQLLNLALMTRLEGFNRLCLNNGIAGVGLSLLLAATSLKSKSTSLCL